MMRRMGFSVGIPLLIGLLFFPFFYYLKVGLKIDVPTWVPFIVSFIYFGTALLGVSYGIVSSSWDPMREGSLLGWTEAKKNWPVFWQSIWSESGNELNCGTGLCRCTSECDTQHPDRCFISDHGYFAAVPDFGWTRPVAMKRSKRTSLTARSQYFSVVTAAKASILSWFCAGDMTVLDMVDCGESGDG
ncbi:hypothetical protein CEY00_Acc28720 [Actinidia chinensis var. chinensis]|uniref:Uncharacterized protein n=1 Tax=Actinidia chinensis var. chinensis TaxID=1590841 RepID=A0A2R6PHL7_ACTCC|nr:hypothetical protein CEY00_Acc28720 [Actinidia chinensis var. chinensis]